MKILQCVLLVSMVASGCMSCRKGEEVSRVQEIDKFGEQLAAMIKKRDSMGFVNLLPNQDDRFRNSLTGRPSEFPINQEALDADRTERGKEFGIAVGRIEAILGDVSDVTLRRIEYMIDESPMKRQLGLFQFDITLRLSGGQKVVDVCLQGCVLCMRGVLSANDLSVKEIEGESVK